MAKRVPVVPDDVKKKRHDEYLAHVRTLRAAALKADRAKRVREGKPDRDPESLAKKRTEKLAASAAKAEARKIARAKARKLERIKRSQLRKEQREKELENHPNRVAIAARRRWYARRRERDRLAEQAWVASLEKKGL